jgi:ubiquinone/menaquinone biosynthesis C-methylase UbiE
MSGSGEGPHFYSAIQKCRVDAYTLAKLSYETKMLEDRARFVKMAGIKNGSMVLDMGTGHGLFAKCIVRKVGENGLVIAMDVSSDHVKEASALFKKEQLSDVAHVVKADLRWTPIRSGILDAVMSYGFLCSINVPSGLSRVFSEAKRILKEEGRIIAIDYFSKPRDEHESLYLRRFDVYKKVYAYTENSLHLTFFTAREIKSLLEGLGFATNIEAVERDIRMPQTVLKKEIRDLVLKINQKSVNKRVKAELLNELRELYKEAKEYGIKVPAALFITAKLGDGTD